MKSKFDVAQFFGNSALALTLRNKNDLEDPFAVVQDLLSKLCFCPYKSDLPTAAHRSDFIAVSLRERVSGRLQIHNPMNLKTRKLQIRLTEAELTYIKELSANYCSMSHYIRSALKEYSDPNEIRQLQLIKALGKFYRDNREGISQVSTNLNNAVKRANELAISGHLTQTYFSEILLPQIINTRIFLESLTRQLPCLTKLVSK